VDRFLHGDPEAEVRGIATAWIPTNEALKAAAEKGLNLFITHEAAFYRSYQGTATGDELAAGEGPHHGNTEDTEKSIRRFRR